MAWKADLMHLLRNQKADNRRHYYQAIITGTTSSWVDSQAGFFVLVSHVTPSEHKLSGNLGHEYS